MEIHYKNPVIFPESFYVEVLDLKELKKKKKKYFNSCVLSGTEYSGLFACLLVYRGCKLTAFLDSVYVS